ncbi:MAG: ROK family protein [Oscillospiraceae bacterium]|nr:ROK family protein [Oscillospiraceae bacterium]
MKYYIGVDLGGTNIAVGIVNEEYKIVGRASVKTNMPRPAEAIAEDIARAINLAAKDAGIAVSECEWVGIGTPGSVDKRKGMVEYANNLNFHDVYLADMVGKYVGKPIYLENDANAAAYGEALAGAGRGVNNMIMLTLGTGVGGGMIINGKIYGGFTNMGAELGHMGIVYNGRQCTCGRKGCIEAYCSATGLANITKDHMNEHPETEMWKMVGGDINKVNGRTAFDGMRKGDAVAKMVVDEYMEYFTYAVANYLNIFQPEVLVVGGGVGKEGETLLAPLREAVVSQTYVKKEENRTKILSAELGNDAGIIGAAMLGNMAE